MLAASRFKNHCHKEKIITVPPEFQLNNLGAEGAVQAVLDDKYILFEPSKVVKNSEKYPCGITDMKAPGFR